MRTIQINAVLAAVATCLASCGQELSTTPTAGVSKSPPAAATVATVPPRSVPASHLPNAFRIHPKVISGGQPDGEAAFQELQSLGVKTIISVDGAKPEVALAKQYGMRYVHLPHGYDGIPDERAKELAKAVRDLPGPIYIHCHHGKHRSPAAATVACVSVGFLLPKDALAVLKTTGTSESYRGLYQSAESARPFDQTFLDRLQVEFRETVELPPMAEAMVAIEHSHDHLKSLAKSKWEPTSKHPDLNAAHEALLLKEHFAELLRTDEVKQKPPRFLELTRDSQTAATELEIALQDRNRPIANVDAAFERVTKNCTACHREFRDIPLQEKTNRPTYDRNPTYDRKTKTAL